MRDNENYLNNITEAVGTIDQKINNLNKQKELLNSLDLNETVTEEKWHEICETDLRYSDILVRFVKNLFPDAKEISNGCNYVYFKLFGFECAIPTSREQGIMVRMGWFKEIKTRCRDLNTVVTRRYEERLEKYYAAVDANAPIMECARLATVDADEYSEGSLLLNYVVRRKKHLESIRKEFEADVKERKEMEKERKKKAFDEFSEKLTVFKEKVLPELRTFSENVEDLDVCAVSYDKKDLVVEAENFNLEEKLR